MNLFDIVLYGLFSWITGFVMGVSLVYYQLVQYSKRQLQPQVSRTNVHDLRPKDRN